MFAMVKTLTLFGINALPVKVEVSIHNGLFAFNIVGLAGKSVQESKERVFSAIKNSGFEMPMRRITVNLSPGDLLKNSSSFDLPIAVAILVATGQISIETKNTIFWGELSLEGKALSTRGALAISDEARKMGYKQILLPHINANEALIVSGIDVCGISQLSDLRDISDVGTYLLPRGNLKYINSENDAGIVKENEYDYSLIKGQNLAKRAIEIACAGGHNVLLQGPPGSGKTYLSRCVNSIMPEMSYDEIVEVTKIYSIAGMLDRRGVIAKRPFRSPHHTCSHVALIGGGSIPRPGEATLSHRGILYLDEFNEFESRALESLRQPIEDKVVNIARASGVMVYPANFMLIASMNPCKCGYLGDKERICSCSILEIERFKHKISGPILDRIDIHVHTERIRKAELTSESVCESSSIVKERVRRAREFQNNRFLEVGFTGVFSNADLNQRQLLQSIILDNSAKEILDKAIDKLLLSARAYFRLLKVARTIADLELSVEVKKRHISEAIAFRVASSLGE